MPRGLPKEEKANPKAAKPAKSPENKRNGNGANLGFEAQMFLSKRDFTSMAFQVV